MSVPLPVLAGVYYARVHGQWEGLPSSNLFTFEKAGVPLGAAEDLVNAQLVAERVRFNWATLATALYSTFYTVDRVSVYPLGSPLLPAQEDLTLFAGGVTGVLAPASVAGLVKHLVNRRGRGSQSRTFLTPLTDGQIDSSGRFLTDPTVATITTQFGLFVANVLSELTIGSPGGIWSYVQLSKGKVPLVGPPVPPRTFQILSSGAEAPLSTQRRRTRRNSG